MRSEPVDVFLAVEGFVVERWRDGLSPHSRASCPSCRTMRISGCDVRISIVRPAAGSSRRAASPRMVPPPSFDGTEASFVVRRGPLLRAECRPPVSLPEELRGHREGCRRRPACQMRHGELSVVVQVEQDGQRRQLIVAGGQLHDDAVGLHAALQMRCPKP